MFIRAVMAVFIARDNLIKDPVQTFTDSFGNVVFFPLCLDLLSRHNSILAHQNKAFQNTLEDGEILLFSYGWGEKTYVFENAMVTTLT